MFTRGRLFRLLFVLCSLTILLFYVKSTTDNKRAMWFATHEVWEDVTFRMQDDSYAYTAFYDPVKDKTDEAERRKAEGIENNEGLWNIEIDEDDTVLRVYLPAEDMRVSLKYLGSIRIGEQQFYNGDVLQGIPLGENTTAAFLSTDGTVLGERSVRFCQASGVATLYVQLQSGDVDEIANDKSEEGEVLYEIVDPDGSLEHNGTATLTARGNINEDVAKKSYNINLDNEASLLGMTSASKWALRATAEDYTMMMDKIVLDTSKRLDVPYAVDADYVNLYIDGEYEGLYLLAQRVKTDGGTVDMDDGYLMEFELTARYEEADQGFQTTRRKVVVDSPEDLEETELNALAAYVEEAEEAVYSASGINENTGKTWFEYLDAASWIKEYWVQEFYINFDADYTSTFLTKQKDDPLLYAGPCWDFDKTFWYTYYNEDNQSNMLVLRARLKQSWLRELDKKADFQEARRLYYLNTVHNVIAQIEQEEIPAIVERIGPSLLMMYDRYGLDFLDETYLDRILSMYTRWIDARLAFYDDYMANPDDYAVLYLDVPENEIHAGIFAFRKGEPITFSNPVFRHREWAYADGRPFRNGDTIYEDTTLVPTDDPIGE